MELKDFIYYNTKGDSDIVAINVFIKYGAIDESIKGLTNLTVSLLGKKTKTKSLPEINEVFESVGGYLSFRTMSDFINISISTKVSKLKESIDTLIDVLQNPVFEKEDFDLEKEKVLSLIRSRREKPYDFAFDNLRKIVYKNTPYEISSLGDEDTINKISLEDIQSRYQNMLKKPILISVVSDNLRDEDIYYIKILKQIFKEEFFQNNLDFCSNITEDRVDYIQRGGAQATILCAFDAPLIKDRNEYFAFKIFNTVLGNGMSSILFKVLREEKGYAYAVSSSYYINLFCSKMVSYIGTSIEKSEDALKDMIDILKNLNITKDHIALAKQKLIGNFLLNHQTRQSKSYTLGYHELMGIGSDMILDYENTILSIKDEDVINVYEKYIKNHQCIVVK